MTTSYIKQIYKPGGKRIDFQNSGLTVYNLGAGKQNFPGVKSVDYIKMPHTDIVHDLEQFPWPIPDNSADVIMAFHYMEHTNDLFNTFKEINRIAKDGCRVIVEVPHFRYSGAFKDPTHKHFITTKTFQYFCRNNHTYTHLPFKMQLVDMSIGWPAHSSRNPIKRVFKRWLNKHLDLYDNRLYLIFMANLQVYEFEISK